MKVFRTLSILLLLTLLPISSKGASWTAPTMPVNEGLPPMGEQIYLLHTGRQMFLTKGTTWGTHAALADNVSAALPYIIYDLGTYQRLYSPKAGNKRYLFLNDGTEGNVYTDYNGQDITCSYWKLQAVNNGHFRIMLASENVHSSTLPNYRLGWNPNNVDKNESGGSLGTNIGIFAVSPTGTGNETEWTYITDEQYAEYEQRCILWNLREQALTLGIDAENIEGVGTVYENPSSTVDELRTAASALQFILSQSKTDTGLIINPIFDGNVNGWTVNMPRAQNKGYQGSSYSNGGVSISGFAEAWISSGRTLGTGEINQTITNLAEGEYILEADVIACNQQTNENVSGVYLFARNQAESQQAVSTSSGSPQHFILNFTHEGGNLTIGLQTLSTTTANWIAFDNVRLCQLKTVTTQFSNDPTPLLINEVQIANIDMFIDPSFNYGGWVELYNPTDKHINLGSVYISDEQLNPLKHQFPADMGFVPAKGFKTVWFDHYATDNSQSDVAYKQVPFKLDYEGGKIFFSNSNGELFLSLEYPQAIQRVSYARTTDGTGTWGMTSTPTPGASNNGSAFASEQLNAPVIDKDACVFTAPFTAHVDIPSGATLRYTLDGSTPTLTNGVTSSNGSFSIAKNTILRLRLYQDGYLPSSVVTRSYIYADKDYYLPIVSVVTDDRNLYDNTIGAYVDGTNGTDGNNRNFSNKNRNWERPVNFEYLVPNNQEGDNFLMAINQECDFEVSGGWSRHFTPASSFRLKGNKYCLGLNYFPYSVFADKPYIKNKALQIRNGGNDNDGRIRDAATHQIILSSGFYNDCQAWQPAHIFINGQYKFMFNVRETNNKNHGYSNYGIDTDMMDQFEINGSKGYEQKSGDDASFRQWMSLAEQLGNDPENEVLYQQICDLVDIDEYINYMAAECYVGSSDWLTNSNNVKGYREKKNGAKFHLVFMDLDSGFGSTNMIGSLQNHLYDGRYDTGKNFLIDIFLNMLKSPTFKKRFIDVFCLVNGSVFEPKRTNEIVTSMATTMEKAMEFDGLSTNLWNSANNLISKITDTTNRNARINNIANYFGLGSAYDVKLSTNLNTSRLLLNGQEIPTNKFNGNLFAPVMLSAIVPSGYRFKGWALSGATIAEEDVFGINDTWKYYDQGSLDGQNWKSNSYSESGWKSGQAPLGYGNVGINGSSDYNTTIDYGTDSSNKRPTYYFRKSFTLDKAPTDDDIYQLTYYVDDGFIAYVNGTEIGRYLMADGDAVYNNYSTSYAGSTAATGTITIDNSLLHQGNNIIAVEVHNTSASSSDIYWTARLAHSTSGSDLVSTNKDFKLSDLAVGNYTLEARFEPIPEEQLIDSLSMPIKVNEISAGNSIFANETFLRNDWIELYNTTDSDLDAAGLYISDDPDDVLKYQIPSSAVLNTIIPAHGHRILWADNLVPVTQLHTTFSLSNADKQMVIVTSSPEFIENNADFFEAHPALKDFADGLPFDTHQGNQSVGRYPDGAKALYLMNRPTIENRNSLLSYDRATGTDKGIMNQASYFDLYLSEGWNWVSHPFLTPLSPNDFKDHVDRILGQTLEAWYSDDGNEMKGSLKSLNSGELYKMQATEGYLFEFTARMPVNLAPVVLRKGWNWIGYPFLYPQTLASAFDNNLVQDGDIVIGQGGFSVYSEDNGWTGTLSSLTPGFGYMYKAVQAKAFRFNKAQNMPRLRTQHRMSISEQLYGFNRFAYPNVMGVIADVEAEGLSYAKETLTMTAWADGECRGTGKWIDGRLFMTLYGQGGETLTFKAYGENGDTYAVKQQLNFASDVIGKPQSPYTLTLIKETTDVEGLQSIEEASNGQRTELYDLSGRKVNGLKKGIYINNGKKIIKL